LQTQDPSINSPQWLVWYTALRKLLLSPSSSISPTQNPQPSTDQDEWERFHFL
jgi:hypothetical protein